MMIARIVLPPKLAGPSLTTPGSRGAVLVCHDLLGHGPAAHGLLTSSCDGIHESTARRAVGALVAPAAAPVAAGAVAAYERLDQISQLRRDGQGHTQPAAPAVPRRRTGYSAAGPQRAAAGQRLCTEVQRSLGRRDRVGAGTC